MPEILKKARVLANYVNSLEPFHNFQYTQHSSYNHIGGLYTDVILQAGLNYNTIVKPRVSRVINTFPDCHTVSGFENKISEVGIEKIIEWKNSEKTQRILSLVEFSKQNGIEYESDLLHFLQTKSNQEKVLELRGIGLKTLHYTMKLLCVDCVAVDRHINTFINHAGIHAEQYDEVKQIVEFAADLLETSRAKLDKFIWSLMSNNIQIRIVLD